MDEAGDISGDTGVDECGWDDASAGSGWDPLPEDELVILAQKVAYGAATPA